MMGYEGSLNQGNLGIYPVVESCPEAGLDTGCSSSAFRLPLLSSSSPFLPSSSLFCSFSSFLLTLVSLLLPHVDLFPEAGIRTGSMSWVWTLISTRFASFLLVLLLLPSLPLGADAPAPRTYVRTHTYIRTYIRPHRSRKPAASRGRVYISDGDAPKIQVRDLPKDRYSPWPIGAFPP